MITFPRYFKPSCLITISGFVIDAAIAAALGIPAPRVVFSIRRSMTPTPDTCSLTVYGLAPERAVAMLTLFAEIGRAPMTLAIGYDGITGLAFTGDIRSMRLDKSQLDHALVMTADDGGDAIADAVLPAALSSTAGASASNQIKLALLVMSTEIAKNGRPPIVEHPSVAAAIAGTSVAASTLVYTSVRVGTARDLLDEAARVLRVRWWLRDGLLFMAARGLPTDPVAVLLPRTHWLDTPSEDAEGLMHVKTFADPNITPGRQLAIQGRLTIGAVELLRVETTDVAGDTEGSTPWSTTCVCRRLGA